MSPADKIEQQAAEWLLRQESSGWSAADAARFRKWLEQSMAHKAAYWRLECAWRAADRLAALGEERLDQEDTGDAAAPRPPWGRRWQRLAIAASLLIAIGLGTILLWPGFGLSPPAVPEIRYATEIGGRRTIALPDGSRVELNTATFVRARLTDHRREFWLDRGEAYFDVAHVAGRPFIVHAGPRTISVLGTRFSVRRNGDRVTVAVLEGRVRIDQPAGGSGTGRSATIGGGDVAVAEGVSTLVAASARQVESSLAWRQGMLSFDQTTLAEAAAEFNRYNRRQLVIGDSETAAIRIGGSFQASNVDAFVRLLHDAYGLRVEQEGERTRIGG